MAMRAGQKLRDVPAPGVLDADRLTGVGGVDLGGLRTKKRCRGPDYRVVSRVEFCAAADFDADDCFLEGVEVPGEGLFDRVA